MHFEERLPQMFPRYGALAAALALACVCLAPLTSGQSIDEMIMAASESADQFDMISDLNGDRVLHELDMMLTIDQYKALNGYDSDNNPVSEDLYRPKRKAIRHNTYRWDQKVIPYNIDSRAGFTSRDRQEIMKAIGEWEKYTCLDFRPRRSSDKNYVNFDNGNGCYSYVGMTGGAQTIGLARGCRYKGVVIHEIGHAVGFHHEQNRPDRDNYVTILFQNIPKSVQYNFKKYPYSAVNTYEVPYDYGSIMHYGGKAFSFNNGYTIKTKNSQHQGRIGNRQGLSFYDIKLANLMYSCGQRCSNVNCPSYGFVDKNCKCWCPGSPLKECSGTGGGGRSTSKPVVTRRPTKTTVPPTTCTDANKNCAVWAKSGRNYCQTNTYVKTYCRLSCKTCDDGTGTGEEKCEDMKEHCGYWKQRGYCSGIYIQFMEENCPKTCGVCVGSRDNSKRLGQDNSGGNMAAHWLVTMATAGLALTAAALMQ